MDALVHSCDTQNELSNAMNEFGTEEKTQMQFIELRTAKQTNGIKYIVKCKSEPHTRIR